jgi:hypothetical protein
VSTDDSIDPIYEDDDDDNDAIYEDDDEDDDWEIT